MRNSERIVIYSALAALGALNIIILLGGGASQAWAQQEDAVEAASPAEKLGPAESLALVDPGNDNKELLLRNRGQHLSWGEEAYHAAQSVAFLHVGKPLYGLITSEPYAQPIQDVRDELAAEAQQRDNDLRALYEQVQALDPNDPTTPERQQDFMNQREEFQRWLQESQLRVSRMQADAMMRAYDEIVAAVEVVSQKKNIDVVLRFLPNELDEETEVTNPEQAQTVIRGRTAVIYPEALDITNAVMEELSLEIE